MTEFYPKFSWDNKEWFLYWKEVIKELEEFGFHIRVKYNGPNEPPTIRINDFKEYLNEVTIRNAEDLDKLKVSLSIDEESLKRAIEKAKKKTQSSGETANE